MIEHKDYIAILDVGHGNCTVINSNDCSTIVDCGLGSTLLEFLHQEGIKEIENVFLSHADEDHIGGLIGLISSDKITIQNVYVNSDSVKQTVIWEDLITTLSYSTVSGGTKLFSAITRAQGEFKCGNLTIETISPTPYLATKSAGSIDSKGRKITSNSISASFRLIWNEKPIVYLAGDIDHISLDSLKDHKIPIEAQLLVFPHHGGNSGGNVIQFTEELCEMTKTETVVFSIGRNKHSNPRPEVVKAVRSKIENVRIACTQLSKHCSSTITSIAPVHLNSAFAKGRSRNECCSGTFILELSETITYSPDTVLHNSYISAATASPICKS